MKQLWLLAFSSLLLLSLQSKDEQPDTTPLDQLMDNWHLAASKADLKAYFEVVTDDFIFLGTDPNERWTKQEFEAFCKPYFDKGSAWTFTKKERNWIFSKDKKIAWFDEKLDTWMGDCRGSGIMVKKGKMWKLAYYNLTVLIENEKIQSFIALRKAER
jgi:hypothetical protein